MRFYHEEPDWQDEPELVCAECGEYCTAEEETFSYAGTHCTHGKSGIHHTGIYVSNCCSAEIKQ